MCEQCGGDLPPRRGGPPRRYCTITCKEKARQDRVNERRRTDREFRERRREQGRAQWAAKHPPKPKPDYENGERECRTCGELKPMTDFYRKDKSGRRALDCRDCQRAVQRERYAGNPDAQAKAKARAARWAKENPERHAELRRRVKRKRRAASYGMTIAQWEAMLKAQSGRCAICAEPMRNPNVDHCHDSQVVRGLLCRDCNTGIGHLKDDVDRLQAAISYLGTFTAAVEPVTP